MLLLDDDEEEEVMIEGVVVPFSRRMGEAIRRSVICDESRISGE